MNIKLSRNLDYYLGIPLCWLLSVLRKVKKQKHSQPQGKQIHPKKVLFIELCEMGSIILSYPAIRKVKRAYPEAEIYFLSFMENTQAVIWSGVINRKNIIVLRNKNTIVLLFDLWRSIRRLRKIGIDTTIDMNLFFRATTIISYLTRASVRVGFYQKKHKGLYRGDLQTHNVLYDPDKHIKENFLLLAEVLNLDNSVDQHYVEKQSETKKNRHLMNADLGGFAEIRDRLSILAPGLGVRHKLFLINLGTNDIVGTRKWPLLSYNKLISRLLKHEDIFIIMVGRGHPGPRRLISHARCLDLINKTSLSDMIHLCNLAQAMVSHDCGMIHIASLTNIFICSLFGPETPKLYAPYSENSRIFYKQLSCSPCLSAYNHKLFPCSDNKCLKAISPDEVYNCLLEQAYQEPIGVSKIKYKC